MVDVYLLHVRKQPRFENVCVSQIYLQAALPGGVVNPLDKIGEPEDINIDVSQSRVTVRNADQQLSIALLGCCHLFICFLSYIFIPYFNSLHMGSEGGLYSSKSTNGGKGLQNSKINSYFTP